jgi:hypothetical protein
MHPVSVPTRRLSTACRPEPSAGLLAGILVTVSGLFDGLAHERRVVLLADLLLRMLDGVAPLWPPAPATVANQQSAPASSVRPRTTPQDKPLALCSPWWHHAVRVLEQAFG